MDIWVKSTDEGSATGWIRFWSFNSNSIAIVAKGSVAEAKAMTRAQMLTAKVVIVLGLNAAYDQEGGGMYHFDPTGTDANNDASVLRPVDYSTAGVLRKIF